MILKYTVNENNKTINQIIDQQFNLSSRLFNKLIKKQRIYLNSKSTDTRSTTKVGDVITIDLNYNEDNSNIIPNKIDLNIIYEDDCFLILNKPAGIAVHPSMLHYDNSLSNGVKFYFDSIGLHKKIRPVNRLDFDTSGIIIFAKNEYVQENLIRQMASGSFHKEYLCLVKGILKTSSGTINAPIDRKQGSIIERCVSKSGKIAITDYEVLKTYNNFSLVKCTLKTGRTHQIRVHMAYIGHPLIGDTLYGDGKSNLINRQALHSYKVSFLHPVTSEPMNFTCDISFINA
ncbi:MAG: RluA family pseudouridine synthase [Clostridia bacterium]|nr:RluA family pseudouridine synthase [Clostridia bacterium]